MIYKRDNALIISDPQIPFEDKGALAFCIAVAREFHVPLRPDNKRSAGVYCVGDEDDQYWGSRWPKSPNAPFTANGEILVTRKRLKPWYDAFPWMKLCRSNHGSRWDDRAEESGIPSLLMRDKREWLEVPDTWTWRPEWVVKASKHHFRVIHGLGYSGEKGHVNAAIDAGISTAMGHLHSYAGVSRIETSHKYLWAMNVGCLIAKDPGKHVALKYGVNDRRKPTRGVGVVIDGGLTPIFLPYERMGA